MEKGKEEQEENIEEREREKETAFVIANYTSL